MARKRRDRHRGDQPERTCICGKTAFATQAAAVGAALRASRRSGHALRIYRCPDGGGTWHLTKKPRWYMGDPKKADDRDATDENS